MAELTIYTIAVGFFLGGALTNFFEAITEDLVAPFAVLFGGVSKSIEGVAIQIGSLKLEVGKAIASTLTLLIALAVVSITLPYIKTYSPLIGARR